MPFSKQALILAFILLFALCLRLLYLFVWQDGFLLGNNHEPNTDSRLYVTFAENIVKGHGFSGEKGPTAFYMPLYPMFLSSAIFISGHKFFIIRIIQAFVFLLVIWLYYLTYLKVFRFRAVAFLSIIFLAVFPSLLHISGRLGTQTLDALTLALAMYFFVSYFDGHKLSNLMFGSISLSLAILTRPTFLFILPLILVIFYAVLDKKIIFIKHSLIMLFIISAMLSPWVIRNYIVFKSFVPLSTEGGWNFYSYNNEFVYANIDDYLQGKKKLTKHSVFISPEVERKSELKQDAMYYDAAFQCIKSYPIQFIKISAYRVYYFWRLFPPSTYSWAHKIAYLVFEMPIIFFGFLGMMLIFARNGLKDPKAWMMISPLIAFTFVHAISISQPIYRIPLMPIVIGFALYFVYCMFTGRMAIAERKLEADKGALE